MQTGGVYYYYLASVSLNASKTLTIGPSSAAMVVLVVSGNIGLAGSAQIIIQPGSNLTIYAAGDFDLGGSSGIQNVTSSQPSNPVNFTLLGTRTEAQIVGGLSMQIMNVRGVSCLSSVIFAPNANVRVLGTGDTYGSVAGNRVDRVGSGNFHQDLSLASIRTSGIWKLLKWRELSVPADRAAYGSQLAF